MGRWLIVAALTLCLGGCEHYTTLTSDDFDRGKTSWVQFQHDSYDCQVDASVYQNMVRGEDPHGTYNDALVKCMATKGHPTNSIDFGGFGFSGLGFGG